MVIFTLILALAFAILAVVFFTFSHNQLMAWHPWDLILDGVIILLFMNLMPRGIGGLLTDLRDRWATRRAADRDAAP